jgi:hypothetical protein
VSELPTMQEREDYVVLIRHAEINHANHYACSEPARVDGWPDRKRLVLINGSNAITTQNIDFFPPQSSTACFNAFANLCA